MIDLKNAPKQGILYALYTDRKVVFQKWTAELDVVEEKNLLELHIFDEEKEFRAIKTERAGFIQTEIKNASCVYDDIYEETIYTIDNKKIILVNYITYDENDLLRIDNYRLKEVK